MKTKIVAVVFVIVCLAVCVGFLAYMLRAKYTAISYLRIGREEPFLVNSPPHLDSEKEFEAYKETQRQLVKSRFVLLAALRKPEVAQLPSVKAVQENGDAVQWLERLVKVEFPGHVEIMSVAVTRDDPDEATTLGRAIVAAYLSEVVDAERDTRRQRIDSLDKVYMDMANELRTKMEDFSKLKKEIADVGNENVPYPHPADVELLRKNIEVLEKAIEDVGMAREQAKIEVYAASRVTLLQCADVPEMRELGDGS